MKLKLIFWVFLSYSITVSVAIQVAVRTWFSQFDLGDGIITLDSTGFHAIAVAQAMKIDQFGWNVWELFPSNQSPAGIASIFYALIYPTPLVMLPFNVDC